MMAKEIAASFIFEPISLRHRDTSLVNTPTRKTKGMSSTMAFKLLENSANSNKEQAMLKKPRT